MNWNQVMDKLSDISFVLDLGSDACTFIKKKLFFDMYV